MIRYSLVCADGHEFDGWFGSSDAYEVQARNGDVICPHCGSAEVSKALMAPNVATSKGADDAGPPDAEIAEAVRKVREHVEKTADYVGDKFAEEARKIHYEEVEPRGIYGEATPSEAVELKEEGVEFHPLPSVPEDQN